MTCAVIYLAHGVIGGRPAALRFLESYRAHPPGAPHRLIIAAKVWDQDRPGLAEIQRAAAEFGGMVVELPVDGLDLGAYFRLAEMLEEENLCLFNTHSEILSADWLRLLLDALGEEGVGMVGPTGSWASMAPLFRQYPPMLAELRTRTPWPSWLARAIGSVAIAYPYRRFIAWRGWPKFPNPHLRSSSFAIRRADLRAYAANVPFPQGKRDTWAIESGVGSLTRWFAAQRRRVLVVDRFGGRHLPEGWNASGTFRTPGQHGLLIADKHTRIYELATRAERRSLEIATWGSASTP